MGKEIELVIGGRRVNGNAPRLADAFIAGVAEAGRTCRREDIPE